MLGLSSKEDLFEEAIFNNTVNLIVPMLSVGLPRHTASGDSLSLAYQVALAVFGLLAALTYIGLPSTLAIVEAAINFDGKTRSTRSASVPSMGRTRLLDAVGLNWEECLKKTICEAHGKSTHFGVLAIPFQIFFPSKPSIQEPVDPFHLAAKNGARGKNCSKSYECFFDSLDILKFILFDSWNPPESKKSV